MVWSRWRNEGDQELIQKMKKIEETIRDLEGSMKGLQEGLSHYQIKVDNIHNFFQRFEVNELNRIEQIKELKDSLQSVHEKEEDTSLQIKELKKELTLLKEENNAHKEQVGMMKERARELKSKEVEASPKPYSEEHKSKSNINHIQRINKRILSSRKKERMYNDQHQPFLPPGSVRVNESNRKAKQHYPPGQSQTSVFNPLKYSK